MAKNVAEFEEGFIEQRTRSLATIYLTRRDDLTVTEAAEEDGVDLTVFIKGRKQSLSRKFGVTLRGVKKDVTAERANAILKPTMEALDAHVFPYPVCLFFFRMENDAGFYTWVRAPIVSEGGNPLLQHCNEAVCAELDTDAVNRIVEGVSAWYDAFNRSVLGGAHERRKKGGIDVLHGIIDGEAAYFCENGKPPTLLKLPVAEAYELAKLGREHLGELAGQIIKAGVRILETEGLLGMKVKLVTDQQGFSFD